jgi:hypothetical protein
MTAAARQMRQESSQRPFPFGLKVFKQVPGIYSTRDKTRALRFHRTQQLFSVFVDESDIAKVDNTLASAGLKARGIPVRSQLGYPWPGQLPTNGPSLFAGSTRVRDLQHSA